MASPSPWASPPSTWPCGERRIHDRPAVGDRDEFEDGDGAGFRIDLDLGGLGDEPVGTGLVAEQGVVVRELGRVVPRSEADDRHAVRPVELGAHDVADRQLDRWLTALDRAVPCTTPSSIHSSDAGRPDCREAASSRCLQRLPRRPA